MRRLQTRSTHFSMILVTALSLLTTSPAKAAAFSEFSPASDNPCSVDILIEADFLPNDRSPLGYGDITFTNLETGVSYLQRSRHTDRFAFDEATTSLANRMLKAR